MGVGCCAPLHRRGCRDRWLQVAACVSMPCAAQTCDALIVLPLAPPADGSLGDMLFFHTYKNPGLVLDIVQVGCSGPLGLLRVQWGAGPAGGVRRAC